MYEQKYWWKRGLFLIAVLIGISSLWYTRQLVDLLEKEEHKKVVMWANATRELVNADDNTNFDFLLNVIKDNETIPVILVDDEGQILDHRNIDSLKATQKGYLNMVLEEMKEENEPIPIQYDEANKRYNFLYYKHSLILSQLKRYPYYQLSVIAIFILVAYLAFSASRKAEQNRVWVGMSKETAHQLGTPISSLNGWVDLLRDTEKSDQESILNELQYDIKRLETIAERFSKIGSAPALQVVNVEELVQSFVAYFKTRTSSKVEFSIIASQPDCKAYINPHLMEWVIENICKNAVDAMEGNGCITLHIHTHDQKTIIDITDTGKGIPKTKLKTVFKPGYTTKKRGWGLGLSLVKRIVEVYHKGKVFVKESSPDKGTTFRIVLQQS